MNCLMVIVLINMKPRILCHLSLYRIFQYEVRGVYLRVVKRRWRHKQTGAIIKRDYSFMAEGSKFTAELSDFLKDASGYATRYHEQYSQLLSSEEQNPSKTL